MKLTCVGCIFRFVPPHLFLKLWLSFLLNMENNKNYKGPESEEIKKNKKNHIQ